MHNVPSVDAIASSLRYSFDKMIEHNPLGFLITTEQYESLNKTNFKLAHVLFSALMKDLIISSKDWTFSTPHQPCMEPAEPVKERKSKNKRNSDKVSESNSMRVVSLTTLLGQTPGVNRSPKSQESSGKKELDPLLKTPVNGSAKISNSTASKVKDRKGDSTPKHITPTLAKGMSKQDESSDKEEPVMKRGNIITKIITY